MWMSATRNVSLILGGMRPVMRAAGEVRTCSLTTRRAFLRRGLHEVEDFKTSRVRIFSDLFYRLEPGRLARPAENPGQFRNQAV
jgi:hypothetical protein